MTIREFYERTGGDYDSILERFQTEKRVEKFLRLFREDTSYQELEEALAAGRLREAFLAAHTLKGVCLNVSFSRLYAQAGAVTDALRIPDPELARERMAALRQGYRDVMDGMGGLFSQP